tara:strand:+ start:1356 stop:1577 length:222 start_codon:yes stop_codon:yes gene_type:complete
MKKIKLSKNTEDKLSKTIDLTPTWSAIWRVYLMVLQNPKASFDSIKDAELELSRMADAADKWNEYVKSTKEEA